MRTLVCIAVAAVFGGFSGLPLVLSAPQKTPPGPDHGVVLCTAMDVAPGKLKDTINLAETANYVFRGRVVALDAERNVSLCFDSEHMRVAGVWVGTPVTYVANKNMGPPVEGKMLWSTRPGPGWDNAGKWDDPRQGGEGPLPRAWARYRGYYVHGSKCIFTYSVGECAVLEMPHSAVAGKVLGVARTFNLGPSTTPHALVLCEPAAGKASDLALFGKPTLVVTTADGRIAAGVVGAPPRTSLRVENGRMILQVPALPRGARFTVWQAKLPANDGEEDFVKLLVGEPADLMALTVGGPGHWQQALETKGTPGTEAGPYVVDQIALPQENPWKASIRFGGLDFFPDGRAALCTWDGDVWIVSGLDDKLQKVTWKRFAAGLQQPLGLKIIDGVIHVAGRDQITRLHDINRDGEADFYENLNNEAGLTLQRHEFVMDLQTDARGNLYYCRSGHYILSKRGDNCCVYKLSPDGEKLERFATGFREPNGMSIGPDGTMTVADNEGNGIPQTPIYRLQPGLNYGFLPAKSGGPNKGTWKYEQPPLVWLPKTVDRSAGGQVWVTGGKFGPLEGQLLHTSYGTCWLYSVLIDKQAEPWQAAVWTFPLRFNSGIMRARMHPVDGQLYLCGLRGWDSNAVKDGQFCRVRYTGAKTPVPVGYKVVASGLEITFSGPLTKASAEDDQNWSGDWQDPFPVPGRKQLKKQDMPIVACKLGNDGRTVTVQMESVQRVSNFELNYRLKGVDGSTVNGALHGTIHRVPAN